MGLTIALSIDRTELGMGALNANDLTNYRPFALGPGRKTYQRLTVSSPDVHGELNVSSALAEAERIAKIRVHGATMAGLKTNCAALEAAFSQGSFSVSGSVNGSTFAWADCTPAEAEWGNGGTWDKFHLMSFYQEVTFIIPSDPSTFMGPL